MSTSPPVSRGALGAAAVVALAIGAVAVVTHPVQRAVVPIAPVTQSAPQYPPGVLPRADLTPGATLPGATAQDVCARGYAGRVRNVPDSEKAQVYREYGLDPKHHEPAEIDHCVSLELSGSNEIANLWPEPYSLNVNGRQMGAREKDKIEDRLHAEVCASRITLADAVQMIRTDWPAAYRKYLGEFPAYDASRAPTGGEKP